MKRSAVRKRLIRLVEKYKIDDVKFLMSLDEYEEPELFNYYKEVEFMKKLEKEERCVIMTEVALDLLDRIAKAIQENDRSGMYFVCITYKDWDMYEAGELAVPTAGVFLLPCANKVMKKMKICKVESREGRMAREWVRRLGRKDICVVESITKELGRPEKVYIGYQERKGILSIGNYM